MNDGLPTRARPAVARDSKAIACSLWEIRRKKDKAVRYDGNVGAQHRSTRFSGVNARRGIVQRCSLRECNYAQIPRVTTYICAL